MLGLGRFHVPLSALPAVNKAIADTAAGTAAIGSGTTMWTTRPRYIREYKQYRRKRRALAVYTARAPARRAFRERRELKFSDDTTTTAPQITWTIDNDIGLSVAQGTGQSERIGRNIKIASIEGLGEVMLNPVSGGDAALFRWYLLKDQQANGAGPTALDIFETDDFNSFFNLANEGRFRILAQGKSAFNRSDPGTVEVVKWLHIKRFFKRPVVIEYSTVGGGLGNRTTNNLLFVYVRSTLGGGQIMDVAMKWRIRYTG